jgi:endonuclease YncB( thermonuclease family)
MTTGLLEVNGTIDLNQFWPRGTSDADTTKILIEVGADAFRFRSSPTDPFQVTHVFDDAIVIGTTRKPVIDKQNRVVVRLQGIDATELHYRPQAALPTKKQTKTQHALYLQWNLEFRQYFAETATDELCHFLDGAHQNPLPCRVVTAVDTPNDVFDTYGRLVGDILVSIDGMNVDVNVNHWLVENGDAVPAFYTSMSEDEITTLIALYRQARSKKRGLWNKLFTREITPFNWKLVFRGKGVPIDGQADRGPAILPKLFRRQSTFQVNKRATMVKGSFVKYLQDRSDALHLTDEFLEQGAGAAPLHFLYEFVSDNWLKAGPEDLVFREKPSYLRKPNGQPVTW